ncbi:SCO family protein [Wenzhouxiangella sp. EGI_FJ10409]|uniref:SCO family protein n=1 Tax=Wenzhouxiangella sp. EGI_FJ10409 TaxID=3243767 RepID=UPI0035DBD5C0
MNIRVPAVIVLAIALSACGDPSWNGKDISGLMPPLAFELTAESGETVTEQDFAGRPVALYFGFTHCPDICPTTLARLVAAVRRLPEPQQEQLQLAFVSVDPERDGPQQLADYTDAFSERMVGLTGSQKQLKSLTRRYRTTYGYEDRREDGSYEVSHSSAIFVFDAEGQPQLMLLDSLGVAEIAADLERLLSGSTGNGG